MTSPPDRTAIIIGRESKSEGNTTTQILRVERVYLPDRVVIQGQLRARHVLLRCTSLNPRTLRRRSRLLMTTPDRDRAALSTCPARRDRKQDTTPSYRQRPGSTSTSSSPHLFHGLAPAPNVTPLFESTASPR